MKMAKTDKKKRASYCGKVSEVSKGKQKPSQPVVATLEQLHEKGTFTLGILRKRQRFDRKYNTEKKLIGPRYLYLSAWPKAPSLINR